MPSPERARLTPEWESLLRAKLVESGLLTPASYIQARPPGGVIPLSSTQRRMWFAQALSPDDASLNMSVALRIDGPLDVSSLQNSMTWLFDHHTILRTRYRRGPDGEPIQVIEPTCNPPLPTVDIVTTSLAFEETVQALAQEISERPFDLASEPALRVVLSRAAADLHALILVLHHIAADETTWDVLLSDLSSRYADQTGHLDTATAPPALQYADYAVWEQQRLRRGDLDTQLHYWIDRLTPLPPTVAFPATTPFSAQSDPTGEQCRHALPRSTITGMHALARAHQMSPFLIVLAGLATVVHRYTHATDLVIGIPVLVRDLPEIKDISGNFTNTLPLRLTIESHWSILDVLHHTRSAFLDAHNHRDIPFERVVEQVAPQRTTGRSPLFEVMFAATRSVTSELNLAGTTTTELRLPPTTSIFDLAIELIDDTTLAATFRTAKYTPEFIQQVLEHLASVLTHAMTDPARALSALPMITESQRERIVHGWNATTDARYPGERPVHSLVEHHALRHPNAIAVVADTEQLTYRELDERAGELAAQLRVVGIGADNLVAINMARSAELAVALLAILKAGAAFVPLEPTWPTHRIAQVCTIARVAAVLTHGTSGTRLPPLHTPVIEIDQKPSRATGLQNHAPAVPMASLAYVEFTSGSTGTPKGVMVTHAGLCNRLLWQGALIGFEPGDSALHKSPLGFDMGINEIFLPLVHGGRVVLARPDTEADPAGLLEQIVRNEITFIDLVPSLLEPILDRPEFASAVHTLRSVWTGGESLSPELLERFTTACEIPMYHGYGPTEATVACTHQIYRPGTRRHTITIGTPNANNQIYILDERLRPLAPGIPGELYVGGIQLARGYLSDPARTADRFVADTVSGNLGARLYRTGDRARFLTDGTIEFLGRTDNQLKIRGRRIAPEEIENTLLTHPAVRRAVVVARDDHLLAYCACDETALTWPQLHDWVSTRLPQQMIPHAGAILAALPQLPSGKIDRGAVQRIPVESTATPTTYLEPRYTIERVLVQLWLDVLDVAQIGVDDNFFDLGGHSLLLARVQKLISEQLRYEVPLLDLYQHPTVAQLAIHLQGTRQHGTDSPVAGSGLDSARVRAQRGQSARTARRSHLEHRR